MDLSLMLEREERYLCFQRAFLEPKLPTLQIQWMIQRTAQDRIYPGPLSFSLSSATVASLPYPVQTDRRVNQALGQVFQSKTSNSPCQLASLLKVVHL